MNNNNQQMTISAPENVLHGGKRPALFEDEEQDQVIGVNVLQMQNAPDPRLANRNLGKCDQRL